MRFTVHCWISGDKYDAGAPPDFIHTVKADNGPHAEDIVDRRYRSRRYEVIDWDSATSALMAAVRD